MRTVLHNSWLASSIVLWTLLAGLAHAVPDDLPPIDPKTRTATSSATAVLRIVCPANSGLTNPALIQDLVQTGDGVNSARAVFEKELGKEALQAADAKGGLFTITLETDRFKDLPAGVYMGDIAVYSYNKNVPADRFLERLREGLQRDLAMLDRDPRTDDVRRLVMEKEFRELQDRATREAKEIYNLERQLGLNVSAEVAGQRLLRVDGELMAASLRVSGLKATRESLQKRIAELGAKVEKAAESDPVVMELRKVVELRIEARAKAKKLADDTKNPGIVRDAEESVAQARAEYARQVRVATQDAGGLRLNELEQRLGDTESELEESDVKLTKLSHQFESLSSQGSSAELEQKKAMLEILRSAANKVSSELIADRLQRQFYVVPTVKLIAVNTRGDVEDKK